MLLVTVPIHPVGTVNGASGIVGLLVLHSGTEKNSPGPAAAAARQWGMLFETKGELMISGPGDTLTVIGMVAVAIATGTGTKSYEPADPAGLCVTAPHAAEPTQKYST